jgi:aspartate aminotransferase
VILPEGGFYLFLDFTPLRGNLATKGIHDSTTMCEKLLAETGVAILPGVVFERPLSELTARLAYVDFDGARAITASETIPLHENLPDEFIQTWCYNVIKAVEAITDWIDS